ncbi:hypothetical protein AVEN_210082-1 [Araneus ventricosus]|uniref:Uncharacterized protein n=1 Tax=Araneus ventricosus TaxID=182803 RepID=A0A4Y2NLE2_ARAVE|nr:hypothetical protein AVEN_210082-1 [Araneus ventricosus]
MRKQKPLWDAFKSYGCSVESKFFKMDLITAKAALCRLLGVNVDVMPFKDVKILVRKRQLLCRPDKNSQIQPTEIFQGTKVAKCIEFAKEKYGEPKLEPGKFRGTAAAPDSKKINYKSMINH